MGLSGECISWHVHPLFLALLLQSCFHFLLSVSFSSLSTNKCTPLLRILQSIADMDSFETKAVGKVQQSSFFALLPREIRDMIYTYAFERQTETMETISRKEWMQSVQRLREMRDRHMKKYGHGSVMAKIRVRISPPSAE